MGQKLRLFRHFRKIQINVHCLGLSRIIGSAQVKRGRRVKIGQLTTQITQEITKDTANVFGSAAFAPTVLFLSSN